MTFLNWTLLSITLCSGEAFLVHPSPKTSSFYNHAADSQDENNGRTSTRLRGIQEWRDEALSSKYALDSSLQQYPPLDSSSSIQATIPILIHSTNILLQGQRAQLNLPEQRFRDLFQDVMDNHCGVVGMGILLAGTNVMFPVMPLCEVESFSRLESWDGTGNGSIFVTLRAVGRCEILVEEELIQESTYMKARISEIVDDDISLQKKKFGILPWTPYDVADMRAGNIEDVIASISSMEQKLKLKEMNDFKESQNKKEEEEKVIAGNDIAKDMDENALIRKLRNAELELLFIKDSIEGLDIDSLDGKVVDEEEDNEDDDLLDDPTNNANLNRVTQFKQAFEEAKETDTFGYVLLPTPEPLDKETKKRYPYRPEPSIPKYTPKELAAISWASFCTGEETNVEKDALKIMALNTNNVVDRLRLAQGMLQEEEDTLLSKCITAGVVLGEEDEDSQDYVHVMGPIEEGLWYTFGFLYLALICKIER
eukprot:CAMPEP_0183705538 /NCGR_PEP_ID=MMETSP0737-20130205/2586_1 /TAXON_ID=385413 /ORGANISM="Thalassiosira miniscula, Strain CCMP1093" /LENGTH=480 /DNA_ID=CAMNT_0025932693 /DNA_START=90 /DNA_END=1529 /DNA_ORIENTATION=-